MSIQTNFPAIKPTLLLDFANVEQLDPRITFARASTATYYGTQTAKAEENLLLQSQDFTTTWVNTGSSETANTSTAPDGTATADTLNEETLTGVHSLHQVPALLASTTYTLSCFIKNVDAGFAGLAINTAASNYGTVEFNLSGSGSVNRTDVLGTGFSIVASSITDVGNSWFRCVATITLGSASVSDARATIYMSDGSGSFDTRGRPIYTGTSKTIEVWGAQLEQRSAATAYQVTTTQPITNYIPVLETAASGVARFDHNPTTFESLGLLIEESRTNLLTYSEQFDNAAWTKSNSTITANTIIAPDGALTGDKLVSDSGQTGNVNKPSLSFTSGTAYTASFYAKKGEFDTILLRVGSTAFTGTVAARTVTFNLTSGTVTTTGATWTSASMTAVGNGWYRCVGTISATSTASDTLFFVGNNTGDGYSGIYIWGAQLESSSFSTSYIPTVASQVTRAADAASMTGTNFSSWYNQAEGTLYAEGVSVDSIAGTTARRYAEINDGTGNSFLSVEFRNTTQSRFNVLSSAVSQATITSGGAINQFSKLVGAYATNSFAFSANGSLGTPDTSGNVPVVTQLSIGNRADTASGGCINGHIRKVAYYPLAATSAQLQGLTS